MLVYQRVTYVLVVVHCHLVEWDCPEEGANMRSLTEHSVYSWTKSTVSPKLCVATGLDQVGLPDTECWVEGLNNCCLLQPTWNKNPGKLGLLSWHPSKPPRYPIYPRKKKGDVVHPNNKYHIYNTFYQKCCGIAFATSSGRRCTSWTLHTHITSNTWVRLVQT